MPPLTGYRSWNANVHQLRASDWALLIAIIVIANQAISTWTSTL